MEAKFQGGCGYESQSQKMESAVHAVLMNEVWANMPNIQLDLINYVAKRADVVLLENILKNQRNFYGLLNKMIAYLQRCTSFRQEVLPRKCQDY